MKFLWLILELMYCISCCQFWYYLHHAFCFFYLWLLCLIKCLSLQCDSKVENVWQLDAFPRKALGDPVVPLVCRFIEWNNLLVWLEWVMNLYDLNSCISFWEEYICFEWIYRCADLTNSCEMSPVRTLQGSKQSVSGNLGI